MSQFKPCWRLIMSEEIKAPPEDPFKPYKDRFEAYQALPAKGRAEDDILKELSVMAEEENTIQFDTCPSMFKMESEIIAMTAKMLNATPRTRSAGR